jgi:hypothetical protein
MITEFNLVRNYIMGPIIPPYGFGMSYYYYNYNPECDLCQQGVNWKCHRCGKICCKSDTKCVRIKSNNGDNELCEKCERYSIHRSKLFEFMKLKGITDNDIKTIKGCMESLIMHPQHQNFDPFYTNDWKKVVDEVDDKKDENNNDVLIIDLSI